MLVGSDEMWGWKERAERRGRWEVTTEKREMKATVEHGWRLPLISTTEKRATAAGVWAATESASASTRATAGQHLLPSVGCSIHKLREVDGDLKG